MGNESETLLARIDERTANIIDKLDAMDGRLNSHGARIKDLEVWRWILTGAGGLILAFVGLKKY